MYINIKIIYLIFSIFLGKKVYFASFGNNDYSNVIELISNEKNMCVFIEFVRIFCLLKSAY